MLDFDVNVLHFIVPVSNNLSIVPYNLRMLLEDGEQYLENVTAGKINVDHS